MPTSRAGSVVRARELERQYGHGEGVVRALDGVELEVAAGETVAVMGPSGCGKSTLLHLLGGLERPSAGEVWLAGRRVDQLSEKALARLRRHAIGFVFQAFHLMDELTAVENVELPALLAGRSPRAGTTPGRGPAGAGRARRPSRASAVGALGRPAPAGRDRPRAQQRAARRPRRRADRQPRHAPRPWTCSGCSTACAPRGRRCVIVTHDARVAATADRLISMRDGAFVEETQADPRQHRAARRARRTGGLTPWAASLLVGRLAARDLRRRPGRGRAAAAGDHGRHHRAHARARSCGA